MVIEAISNNLTVSGNNGLLGATRPIPGASNSKHMAVVSANLLLVIIVSKGSMSKPFITPRKNGIEISG